MKNFGKRYNVKQSENCLHVRGSACGSIGITQNSDQKANFCRINQNFMQASGSGASKKNPSKCNIQIRAFERLVLHF